MANPVSPRQVVEALIAGISNGAWLELHTWFSDDAVVEYPFALPVQQRLEGMQAIQKHFAAVAALPLSLKMRPMTIRQTDDPEVVVAEWDYDGVVTTTGHSFCVSNITVSRVRNGKIVASRDYHNHAIMAHALGRLAAMLAPLKTD